MLTNTEAGVPRAAVLPTVGGAVADEPSDGVPWQRVSADPMPSADQRQAEEPPQVATNRGVQEPIRLKGDPMNDVLRRTDAMLAGIRDIDQRLTGAGIEGVGAVAKLYEQLHSALAAVSVEEIDSTLGEIDSTRRSLDTIARDLGRLRRLKLTFGDGVSSGH
jgi:hypothetical protein